MRHDRLQALKEPFLKTRYGENLIRNIGIAIVNNKSEKLCRDKAGKAHSQSAGRREGL